MAQRKIHKIAFLLIAAVSVLVIPFHFFKDISAGNLIVAFAEILYLFFIIAGLVFMWAKKSLVYVHGSYAIALGLLAAGLVASGGGTRGIGFFYFLAGYPILYHILGVKGGVIFPVLLFSTLSIRLLTAPVGPLSLYNDKDLLFTFLPIAGVATILGVFSVLYQDSVLKSLHRAARFDETTGLLNRYGLEQHLIEKIGGENASAEFSLLGIKILNFSQVNSIHGNRLANQLITAVSSRLKKAAPNASSGRYTGTIFVLVIDNTDFIELDQLGNELLSAAQHPITIDGRTISLQAIVSITRFPQDGPDQEQLFSNLVTSFSRMKNRVGTVSFFDESLHKAETERYEMVEELRQAMAMNELHLVYHPKICMKDQSCNGAEVLLRWKSSRFGDVPPYIFIPLAEEAGLIQMISRWVVRTALSELESLDFGNRPLTHAINLSPKDLADSGFRKFLLDILKSDSVRPGLIEFEITEGTMMNENPAIQHTLDVIRQTGCRLAIDDFGTGYSSLSYLHRLRANNLKIDRSFIIQLNESNPVSPVVDAIISMALSLKMDITAEGVETEFQEQYLRERNCTYGQGWLYAKPVRLEEYRELLSRPEIRAGQQQA